MYLGIPPYSSARKTAYNNEGVTMLYRSTFCFGAAIALSVSLYAQGGRPTTPTPTPTPTTPTNPGSTIGNPSRSPFPTNPTTTPPASGLDRPIYLSGRVMLDDGNPPPEPVSIQRICGTTPRTEAYTDSKGRFSFEWGKRLGVMPDASEDTFGRMPGMSNTSPIGNSGGMSQRSAEQMMMGCELRASLAGFRSDSVNLSQHRSMDNPDVGTIILHRVANVEGLAISVTTLMAPKDAKKAYEKGLGDLKKNKPEDAQRDFEKAVEVYPKFAAAWFELGRVQRDQKDIEAARKSFAQALAADSKYIKPYLELSDLSFRDQNWKDVKDSTDRLLSLNPVDFPKAWYFNAVAKYELKDYDAAEKSARDGVKNDPGNTMPRMNQLLGVLLAGKEDYPGAAEALKNYLKVAPNGSDAETVKKQLAMIEQKMQANAAPAKDEQK
jgi:TolA-binding protein